MIKTITVALIAFALFACQEEANHGVKQQNIVDLSLINSEYWDVPSKQILQILQNIPFEELSYSQSKQLAEILIVHDNQMQAIGLLQNLDYSKSQYLTYLLSTALYKKGELESSIRNIHTASFPDPNSSITNLQYKILLELGRPKTIIELAQSEKILGNFSNTLSKYYLAMAFLQNNNCKESIVLFKQVLKENPRADKVYTPLANAYQQCKDAEAAKIARENQGDNTLSNTDEFYARLHKNGDPVAYNKSQLDIAIEKGDKKSIIEISEKLIKFKASNPTLLNNYAISLYQSGSLALANEALFKASELDRSNTKSLQLLFEFNRNSNLGIAKKAIDQLIAIDPNNNLYQQAKKFLDEQKR